MSSPIRSAALAASSTPVVVDKAKEVSQRIQLASCEPNLDKKREIFETAFQLIRSEPKNQALYDLLEAYARETCYDQVKGSDEEWGFRASARLLELAICLQLDKVEYSVASFESLQALLESLEKGEFFSIISALPDTLVVEDSSRSFLAKAFIRLAFSYQNIEANEKDLALHKKLNTIVENLLGTADTAHKRQLVDFRYNRCGFMVRLADGGWNERFASYEPVLELLKECYTGDEIEARGLRAQIANMRGICTYEAGGKDKNACSNALPYFFEAFGVRNELVAGLKTDDPIYWHHKRLLKNVVTTLLTLTIRHKTKQEGLLEAVGQMGWLVQFMSEAKTRGDEHSYDTDDVALLAKAQATFLS